VKSATGGRGNFLGNFQDYSGNMLFFLGILSLLMLT
jgi:hypothetical protein